MSHRIFVRSTLCLFLVVGLACGAGQQAAEPPAPSAQGQTAAETVPAETTPPAPEPAPEPLPEDAPLEIRVRGEVGEGGQVAPVVEVRGGTAHLAKAIGVEREVNGHFQAITQIATLELRADCRTPAPDCVELVAGAELRPPAWLGTWGDAQCICTRCWPAPAGSYRFVLTSCDGRQRVESAPFTLPER